VKATAGDECTLSVAGGVTTPVTADTATVAVYETLSVDVVTTAVPAPLVVSLLSKGASDVCDWSNPTLVEVSSQPQIGATVFSHSEAIAGSPIDCTTYLGACSDLTRVTVTPPGPGYVALLKVSVPVAMEEGSCDMRIWNGASSIASTHLRTTDAAGGDSITFAVMTIDYILPTPLAAGTSVTYQVDVEESDNICQVREDQGGETMEARIQVLLLPTGF
jgi:hypothetical protein